MDREMKTQSETEAEERASAQHGRTSPREVIEDRDDSEALRDWLDLEDYPLDEAGYGHGV